MGLQISEGFGTGPRAQRASFDRHFDIAECAIATPGGTDVGYLTVERHPDHLFLRNVAPLPSHRRRGIGTAVLRDLIAESERRGVSIRLEVLWVDPARRWYERMGFEVVSRTDSPFVMTRPPRLRP